MWCGRRGAGVRKLRIGDLEFGRWRWAGWGGRAEREVGGSGACTERDWAAHSVRRESCNSASSPEPAARWFGGGLWGDKRRDTASTSGARRQTSVGRWSGVEVGVFVGFFGDGGAFAVAWEDDGGGWEGEDFAADACDEEGVAAAGEVGAADAAGHEGVAGEGAGAGGVDEDEAVWGVAGDVGDGELEAGDGDGGVEVVAEGMVDGVIRDIEGGAGPLANERFESVIRGAGVPCVDGGTGGGDGGGVHDVVEVGVGEEEGGWADIFCGEEVGHAIRGVDDDPSIGGFEGETVGGGDAAGEHEDLVHGGQIAERETDRQSQRFAETPASSGVS